ncbi:LLM class flavin-dependent oxidoreductase [Paenibacillus sp. WQ 127069]|uniref:LLM class flavin-dependent oxidoreductase n=1 Tax=Paenibacillus baimaensis TaxID=2982185 RepID=A0ABT2UIL5_9BACL|nr:LLM class flavin-dependent oxidoreductase [Paenibacillus sp. WQ 127069]MCU6794490.1 LLM class flavin-dependent oxidoreductase [Paenibacillus sp. WQ 127069]
MSNKQMKLGAALLATGEQMASWLYPGTPADGAINLEHYKQMVQKSEAGKLDFAFIADGLFINEVTMPQYLNRFEPVTAISVLSAHSSHIGLVGTVSATYSEPFTVARQFASLDLLSGGRAGWNLVTSALDGAALNYSRNQHPSHADRYELADEHLSVVKGLWDSWEDDAFSRDKESGVFFDPEKMHRLDHKGKHFSVQGPVNIGRSPQGYPVIFQAGSSEAGKELAAKGADAVFTGIGGVTTVAESKHFYDDVKGRLAKYGRTPDELLILPGIAPVVGATEEEAQAKYERIAGLISIETALRYMGRWFNHHDFTQYPLDEPFPELGDTGSENYKSVTDRIKRIAKEGNLTLRQVAIGNATPRGPLVGTPVQIADELERFFRAEAVDGFILLGHVLPEGINDFVDHVVPILQERGLFRTEYEHTTLRGHLGLAVPVNRYEKHRQSTAEVSQTTGRK